MPVDVKVVQDRTKQVKAGLKALIQDRVLVGIPSEKAFRAPEPGEKRPLNNAEIGYLQENGAPEINLPARPHLVPGVQRVQPQIVAEYRKVTLKALTSATDPAGFVRAAETRIGFLATSSVKNLIADGISPPLAERTIAARKKRGRDGVTPLLDTGAYRNSIDFVIRPAGSAKRKKKK
ncbi:hypothetical protein PX554_26145 [Sphingomonas sp. H39-1-10]|uniref:hypothetical protein n=1 Tax=Sphingomonas pollutisoli TaxID=3030829 RepID=UPI0023B91F61|nr:hypothetical protein [Sphingomonas pollutisoli]MDF0491600.1 hypothetical protein [Sphingomonas pollutisoli]